MNGAIVRDAKKRSSPRSTLKELKRSRAQVGKIVKNNPNMDTPQSWALWEKGNKKAIIMEK